VLTANRLRAGALALGLVVSAALVALAQAGGDQLNLLARGWLLAARGELVPYGNPLSTGGAAPGALTSVAVGAPLAAWMDHRAPVALIWLGHLAAWLLLDRALRPALSPLERAAFAVVYWLNPWRVEAAGFLWNPNYLPLVGAVHLATARALAGRARFGVTFFHVLALGLGAQLHPSVLLLGVLSVLLWARGYARVSWPGFAAGVAATGLTLVPWLAAVAAEPRLLATGGGFPFRGLVYVFPLLKGLSYWLRYPSLALHRETAQFDFGPRLGAATDAWLGPSMVVLVAVAGVATMALALWANVAFFRARARSPLARWRSEQGPRSWLDGYAALALAAAVAVFAASPTTPQSWQAMPLLHAAALPVVRGVGLLGARLGEMRALRWLAAAAALALAFDLALAAGAPNFRCGGRAAVVFPLRSSSPMFEEIGLQATCPWPYDVPGGWWPDVLPRESGSPHSGDRHPIPDP
jgi:hypothetical protein